MGASDLQQYQALVDDGAGIDPLPRLVLVIDEFRLLADELPTFLSGLVRIAAVGRSLGVHLVLATQRPAGVVSADIKANVNLRIALRVRDRVDSDDVIDAPDAAWLPEAIPGRALARSGSSPLRTFQVARANAHSRSVGPTRPEVQRVSGPEPEPIADLGRSAGPSGQGPDVLARLVRATREAAESGGVARARRPWLPPLPDQVALADLPDAPTEGAVAMGLVDLPQEQAQVPYCWHPAQDSHLAISGAPRSGRSTALATLALGLARTWSPADLEVHVVDAATGALRGLDGLPHTGSVVTREQPHLISRLVARLARQVRERHHHPGGTRSPLVLLVDGWDAMVQALEDVDHGRPVDDLLALLRDGESVGLRAVVAGERGVLLSRLSAVVTERLLLRTPDPTDALLAGLPPMPTGFRQVAGRGRRGVDGAEVQLAGPPPGSSLAELVAAGVARARLQWVGTSSRAVRVAPLPVTVTASEVQGADRAAADGPAHPGAVLLGLGGDDARPASLDLTDHPLVLVAGPPGSGRTTTLLTIATGLRRSHVAVVAPRASTLSTGPWPNLPADDPNALRRLLDEVPALCLLVDDADLLVDSPLEPLLVDLARRRGTARLVVASTTRQLLHSFRGIGQAARSARTGVLLQPQTPSDGEVFGLRAPLPDVTVPGRGLLVVRGTVTPIQVATPDDVPVPATA